MTLVGAPVSTTTPTGVSLVVMTTSAGSLIGYDPSSPASSAMTLFTPLLGQTVDAVQAVAPAA